MAPRASKRVGLEISNSAVRIAEVSFSGGRAKLVNLGQVRLPARAVVDGAIADIPAVTGAINPIPTKQKSYFDKALNAMSRATRNPPRASLPDPRIPAFLEKDAFGRVPSRHNESETGIL